MKPLQSRIKRADYGIDAPTVFRNFFLIGIAGCIVGTILAKFGSGRLPNWLVSFYGACLGIGGCFVLQGKASDPPFASAQRYAFSRGLVPGIDAFCTQAIAHASLVGEKSRLRSKPLNER